MNPNKSSFLTRTISKVDAIIQFFRPQMQSKVTQALDVFDRLVGDAESATKLGIMLQPGSNGGERFHVTPEDLRANLDEFAELEKIATLGRAFLNAIGYSPVRKTTPLVGSAPVGKQVDVKPITIQQPGQEPLEGAVISPKKK